MRDDERFPLTRALGEFAAGARAFPDEALAIARDGIVDAICLTLHAREEPMVQALREIMRPAGGTSCVLFTHERADAVTAATLNAAAAHAYALDDVAWGCHPSAMLLPALLAAGEAAHASGEALLRAWVVGHEVLGELATREPGALHGTGWHPSGLLGPVAVAAAVAHVQGLDASTASRAIASAASMTGGISANFGTPIKALHAGRASAAGVLACELARRGLVGNADVLERAGGLLETISPSHQVDLQGPVSLDASRPRLLQSGNSLKRYPLCYSLHRVADAAIALAQQHDIAPAGVEAVEISLGTKPFRMASYLQPTTGMQARYSAPFAAASGLVAMAAGFAQLEPAFYESEAVRRLIACTRIIELDGARADDPVFAPADRVRVRLNDGRWLDSGEVAYPRGHARKPLTAQEREAKFVDCVAAPGAQGLFEQLQSLRQAPSVRQIVEWVSSR